MLTDAGANGIRQYGRPTRPLVGRELDMLKRLFAALKEDFAGAPIAWIVLGLFVMAAFGNWHKGNEMESASASLSDPGFSLSPGSTAMDRPGLRRVAD